MGWEEHDVHLGAVVLNREPMSESPGGPHPRISDSGGLGWGLGMWVSNFPGDTDAADQRPHFETH